MNEDKDKDNLNYKTVQFLCNYKTHIMRQIQFNKENYCTTCCNEITLNELREEIVLLENHIYQICNHVWIKDYIEIKEEMHPIILCDICNCNKNILSN